MKTMKYLFDWNNRIWKEEIILKEYKSSTITPLLKKGKVPKGVKDTDH